MNSRGFIENALRSYQIEFARLYHTWELYNWTFLSLSLSLLADSIILMILRGEINCLPREIDDTARKYFREGKADSKTLQETIVRRRPMHDGFAVRLKRANQPSSVDNRSSSKANKIRHVITHATLNPQSRMHLHVTASPLQQSRTASNTITVECTNSRMSKYILSAAKCRVHFPN